METDGARRAYTDTTAEADVTARRLHPYAGERVVLLTQHGKETVLAPLFRDRLGASLDVERSVDTDTLGTFTRDVPRAGTQLDAARRKARLAIELGGGSLGLGSEGSLLPGPMGLGGWMVELVVLIDARRGIEVIGRAQGPGVHAHGEVGSIADLEALATRAGFPTHGLVVRPNGPEDPGMRKGMRTMAQLHEAFDAARRESTHGRVFVETDLRAHHHPTRMAIIARAGADLVDRLATPCPACQSPGVGIVTAIPGVPCALCGTATEMARAELYGCVRCTWREERPRPGAGRADPQYCPACNP